MDFVQKAKVRLEHWIGHNDHHLDDYDAFAKELEAAGKAESAQYIREMILHSARSNECLRKALLALIGEGRKVQGARRKEDQV